MKHLGPLALFGALAIAWTWPLALHLHDAVPGDPGDNYSFLWNLWWMRHVLATPGLAYFHTTYLFYPFGTTIADHPHTALPALVAATLLRPASIVTAQNLLLLAYVFANMGAMYALVWDVARHRRAAVLGGVIFGLSPYLAAHLLGHFDLMAAWVLPLFALLRAAGDARGLGGVDGSGGAGPRGDGLHALLLRRLPVLLRRRLWHRAPRLASRRLVEEGRVRCRAAPALRGGGADDPARRWRRLDRVYRRADGQAGRRRDRDSHAAERADRRLDLRDRVRAVGVAAAADGSAAPARAGTAHRDHGGGESPASS